MRNGSFGQDERRSIQSTLQMSDYQDVRQPHVQAILSNSQLIPLRQDSNDQDARFIRETATLRASVNQDLERSRSVTGHHQTTSSQGELMQIQQMLHSMNQVQKQQPPPYKVPQGTTSIKSMIRAAATRF